MKPDIVIEMAFNMATEKVQIKTNAKHEFVGELIGDYVRSQIGAGKDTTPAEKHEIYNITIGVELDDDSWGSHHNCGNKGLREGILMRVMGILSSDPSKVTYLD